MAGIRTVMVLRRLKAVRPDLIVVGFAPNEGEASILALLNHLPATRIMALGPNGRMTGYEFCLCRSKLSDLSPENLIDFIRAPSAGLTADDG